MFLLAYRSSKHETTGMTPSELYFARQLRLPLDLLREGPAEPCEEETVREYVRKLREKLLNFQDFARKCIEKKAFQIKVRYDRGVRQTLFQEGEKVWFFNPRRFRGKTPKLQSNWEGPFIVTKRLSEVVYCIRKSPRHKGKVVHGTF